jgi:hypothetical protein
MGITMGILVVSRGFCDELHMFTSHGCLYIILYVLCMFIRSYVCLSDTSFGLDKSDCGKIMYLMLSFL